MGEDEVYVSPMITCPECGAGDIDKRTRDATWEYEIDECYCMNCGANWNEINFNPDEWEDD